MAATTDILAGIIPLTDSAILVVARECGFAEEEDIGLTLIREISWANIRDRIAIGHFANAKAEGALKAPSPVGSTTGTLVLGPDGFFDGAIFDPDKLDDYIAAQRPR